MNALTERENVEIFLANGGEHCSGCNEVMAEDRHILIRVGLQRHRTPIWCSDACADKGHIFSVSPKRDAFIRAVLGE